MIISGCSGGGKSTLISALGERGFETVSEPGREIVREELQTGGEALPWVDGAAFARRCLGRARDAIANLSPETWTFFDRSLVDAAVAMHHLTGHSACSDPELRAFHRRVFLVPPWPELFVTDDERQLDFDAAVAEYNRLHSAYTSLGYDPIVLPTVSVAERVDLVLTTIASPDG